MIHLSVLSRSIKVFGTQYMNSTLRKIIEGLVGIVTFIMFLRLLIVPTYAFIHSRNEPLLVILLILESVLSAFVAYMVVSYIHKYL